MVFMDPLIEVALIAFGMFIVMTILRERFMDHEAQELVKAKNKEWKQALKSSDTKKIEAMNKEMMELQMRVMKGTMPVTMISLAIFVLVIYPLNGFYAEGFPLAWKVALPLLDRTPSWLWYYILINILLQIAFGITKKAWKKRKALGE